MLYKISYIRKKRKLNITERRRNGDWMTLNGHWMVTEMYLPFSRLIGHWMMTEWRLSVFTEWWHFVLWVVITRLKYISRLQYTRDKTGLGGHRVEVCKWTCFSLLHLKKDMALTLNKFFLNPRMICAKFDWNWHSGPEEDKNLNKIIDRQI